MPEIDLSGELDNNNDNNDNSSSREDEPKPSFLKYFIAHSIVSGAFVAWTALLYHNYMTTQ